MNSEKPLKISFFLREVSPLYTGLVSSLSVCKICVRVASSILASQSLSHSWDVHIDGLVTEVLGYSIFEPLTIVVKLGYFLNSQSRIVFFSFFVL